MRSTLFWERIIRRSSKIPGNTGQMIFSRFKRGWFARVLRTARAILGDGEANLPPRGPYVQGVTAYSAVICWVSASPDAGVVEYGESPEMEHKEADSRVGRRHAVALTGLASGST